LQWFDALPESEAYYSSLEGNEDAIHRVRTILAYAPRLVNVFKENLPLTEALLSGEIDTLASGLDRWDQLALDAPERTVATTYTTAVAAAQARWVLALTAELQTELTLASDGLLRYCCQRFHGSFDLIALGSYGCGQLGVGSDLDVLMLSHGDQSASEGAAQAVLNFLLQMKRYGLPVKVDLRLRPDGQKGLLVRSFNGFGAYEVGDMEMWERFALGHARLVVGSSEALDLVRHAAYALSLSKPRLDELLSMKARIESERLKPQYQARDVKLGHGGLNDLEWIVHLLEMKDPQRVGAGVEPHMTERIRSLGRSGSINSFETESLLEAQRHLIQLRDRISLLDLPADLVPENPRRLDRLAHSLGLLDGNEFLRAHEPIVAWVRGFLVETISRLIG
jgi:glutamate-ammonia-ligase adenylyltransferase